MSEFFNIGEEESRSFGVGQNLTVRVVTAKDGHAGDVFLLRNSGKLFRACGRCGGTGHYSFNPLDGTRCFDCYGHGLGFETTWKDAEKLVKARRAAQIRKHKALMNTLHAEAKAWDEFRVDHADVIAFLSGKEEKRGFLGDVARKAASLLPLSERMVSAVRRIMAEDAGKAEKNIAAGYFGTVGKREEFKVRVTMVRELETQFGLTMLIAMTTNEGHALKTFSAGAFGGAVEVNGEYIIKATVKAHEEYNGRPQTVLTRVALAK